MPQTTGYTSTTRANIALGAGVVTIGGVALACLTGPGASVEIERTWRQPVVHAASSPIRGLDVLIGLVVRLRVTVLDWARAAVHQKLEAWEFAPSEPSATGPAAQSWASAAAHTWASAAGDGWSTLVQANVVKAMSLLAASQAQVSVRALFDGVDGVARKLTMAHAVPTTTTYKGAADGGEATCEVVFEARLEPTGSPLDVTKLPYTWEIG